MKNVAVILRALQLYAHNAHNLAKGKTFLEDHELFGDFYAAYEKEYDSVVERMIGLGQTVDLRAICQEACDLACGSALPSDNEKALQTLLATEKSLVEDIEKVYEDGSCGTQNLLAQIADNSEARQYLLIRRLK